MSDHKTSLTLEIKERLDGLQRANAAVEQFEGLLQQVGKAMPFGAAVDITGRLSAALAAIPAKIKQIVSEGVALNGELDAARLSIAAVMRGASPGEFPTFAKALERSSTVLWQIKEAASAAGLETAAMSQAFAVAHAAMTKAAVPMREQIRLVTDMTLAAKVYKAEAPGKLLAGMFNGKLEAGSPLALGLQLTPAGIEDAHKGGRVLEYLTERTRALKEASDAATTSWEGLQATLRNNMDDLKRESTTAVFENVKRGASAANEIDWAKLGRMVDLLFRVSQDVSARLVTDMSRHFNREQRESEKSVFLELGNVVKSQLSAMLGSSPQGSTGNRFDIAADVMQAVSAAALAPQMAKAIQRLEADMGKQLGQLYTSSAARLLQPPDSMARRGAYVSATVAQYQNTSLQVLQGILAAVRDQHELLRRTASGVETLPARL